MTRLAGVLALVAAVGALAYWVASAGYSRTVPTNPYRLEGYVPHDGERVDLGEGQTMEPGQSIGARPFFLTMQRDGNLVATAPDTDYLTSRPRVVWSSGTGGNPGAYARMGGDGNFVVYSERGIPLWASGTAGQVGAPECVMTDQTDGIPFAEIRFVGMPAPIFSVAPCYAGTGSRTVAVVGDSITLLAQSQVERALAAAGYRYTVSAQSGWTIGMQLPAFSAALGNPAGAPDAWVVELGTDNAIAGVFGSMPSANWTSEMDQLFAAVGDRCTIVVNVSVTSTASLKLPSSPVAQAIDRVLAAWVVAHPNMHLVDWNSLVAHHPEWLRSDGVHPNATGAAALGLLYASALQDYCR